MVVPGVYGYPLCFCCRLAPVDLRNGDARHKFFSPRRVRIQAGVFTLIPLAATAALALAAPHTFFSEASVKTAFIMLSVLTLPHMIMPQVLARLSGDRKPGLPGSLTPPAALRP